MTIDLTSGAHDWRDVYRLCLSFINPRPIALVSSVSAAGRVNLAPYSFYNMVCSNPPTVMISTGLRRDGRPKDTWTNVNQTREFVVATVVPRIARQMVDCAADLPYGDSEFAFSGLTPAAAQRVAAPLVAEAPVNIECTLRETLQIGDGPGSARLIFGEIRAIHVADEVLSSGACDPHQLSTLGRLGGKWYCDVTTPYEMEIPPPPA